MIFFFFGEDMTYLNKITVYKKEGKEVGIKCPK